MRYIAIDYGQKRIGVAGSDSGIIAQPLEIVPVTDSVQGVGTINQIVKKYTPEVLVFGLPVNEDNSEGPQAQRVKEIIDQIKKLHQKVKVKSVNEFLTSNEAQTRSQKKVWEPVDDHAAAIILEQYFHEEKRAGSEDIG